MKKKPNSLLTVLMHGPIMASLLWGCSTPAGANNIPFIGQFCGTATTPGSGNLDRPAGVAIAVQRDPSGTPQQAYAVSVNPDLRQARAVDMKAGIMVPAPAVYFPMAVKLGTYTEEIAVSDDGTLGVALDAADQGLFFFNIGAAPAHGNIPRSDNANWFIIQGAEGDDLQDGIVTVDARPTGHAVHGNYGSAGDLLVAISHAGDPTGSLSIIRVTRPAAGDGNPEPARVAERTRINLGGRPSDVDISEDGRWVVVSNAAGPNIFLVPSDVDPTSVTLPLPACDTTRRACTLDVGGPTNDVTVGTAPTTPGGARYPVALVLRVDTEMVGVVRLRTDIAEAPEPTERLEANVVFPRPPAGAALAPEGAPLCCSGGPFITDPTSLAQGGFAYAVVAQADGSIVYLDLNARDATGRRTPRIIDTNSAAPAVAADVNTAAEFFNIPGVDAADPLLTEARPQVQVEVGSDAAGAPLVVNQLVDGDFLFTWEGVLPGLDNRRASSSVTQLTNGIIVDGSPELSFAGQGVRAGDILEIPEQPGCECAAPAEGEDACEAFATLPIVRVAGSTLEVEGTFPVRECLGQEAGFIYRVRAGNSWAVYNPLVNQNFGRVQFFEAIDLPGARVRLLPAGWTGGIPTPTPDRDDPIANPPVFPLPTNPPPRGSTQVVPLRSNFSPFRIDLDDVDFGQGRFVAGNALPTGIATAFAPTYVNSSTPPVVKAIGMLSTAGGGLLLQFDLGLHPPTPDGVITRGILDPSFIVYE